MTHICCPFDSTSSIGGVVLGGSAYVDVVSDPYDGAICILPLDEEGNGVANEYKDRTRHHFDGTAGKILATADIPDATTYPEIDDGVFCLPSQQFAGRQLIHIDQDTLSGNHDFTVSLWAKLNTFAQPRVFYSRGFNDGTGKQYVMALGHSFLNNLSVSVHTLDPAEETLYYGSSTLLQRTWYHIAASYTRNTIKLFVNGVQVMSKVLDGDMITLENECFLGTRDYTAYLDGNTQELHVFPDAKSANYLLAEYRSFCNYFVTEGGEEPLLYW